MFDWIKLLLLWTLANVDTNSRALQDPTVSAIKAGDCINSVCFLVLVQDSVDYQGRSYLHIPQDIDVRLDTDEPPERCYLPKKHIHTWSVKAPSYYFLCYQKNMIIIVIIHSKYFAVSDWLQSSD